MTPAMFTGGTLIRTDRSIKAEISSALPLTMALAGAKISLIVLAGSSPNITAHLFRKVLILRHQSASTYRYAKQFSTNTPDVETGLLVFSQLAVILVSVMLTWVPEQLPTYHPVTDCPP